MRTLKKATFKENRCGIMSPMEFHALNQNLP